MQQLVLCTGHISHYFLTESTQKDLKNHKGGHTNHCCNCPHSNTSTIQAPIVTYLGCLPDMGRTPVRPQVKGRIVSDQCSLLAREKSKEAANRQRPRHCRLARGAGLDKPHVGNIRQENKRKPILSAKPPNPFGKVHSPAPLLRGSPVTSVTGLSKNLCIDKPLSPFDSQARHCEMTRPSVEESHSLVDGPFRLGRSGQMQPSI